jgi:hypothetical protein
MSGFYIGNWNSSISWLGRRLVGVGAGRDGLLRWFKNTFKMSDLEFNYDVGVLQYYYPGGYSTRVRTPPSCTRASAMARCS